MFRAPLKTACVVFTGIDSPYEAPLAPEFVIDTRQDDGEVLLGHWLQRVAQGCAQGTVPPVKTVSRRLPAALHTVGFCRTGGA
ncbi:adenylyl-sulfate kinase [Pseudomonas syringae]|nr:adenylyl-sulfate kinase [Pseudomonas syringae]